jgi:histidyl-tRNA synthetase
MRTVLIGKGRRVTLEELHVMSLQKEEAATDLKNQGNTMGPGLLELTSVETDQSSVTTNELNSVCSESDLLSLMQRIASWKGVQEDEHNSSASSLLLSEEETRATLTLLANFCAQQQNRHIISIALTLVQLLNSYVHIRMSRNVDDFMSQLKHVIQTTMTNATTTNLDSKDDELYIVIHSALKRILPLSVIAMAAVQSFRLVKTFTMDALASLSVEYLATLIHKQQQLTDPKVLANFIHMFDDSNYDLHRPHRGMMNSASVIRVCIQGSKFGASNVSCSEQEDSSNDCVDHPVLDRERLQAIESIPAYHGPATDAVLSAMKVIELECNCFETYSIKELDATVLNLICETLFNAISILTCKSMARMGTKSSSSSNANNAVMNDDSLSERAHKLSIAVRNLYATLSDEAKINVQFMEEENAKALDMAKKKAEEKAARAAEIAKSSMASKKDEDSLEGMTEAQKQKILKKRAEKEAKKAAKKKAAKNQNGPGGAEVSIFGSGSMTVMNILKEHDYNLANEDVLYGIEEIVGKLLSGGVQRKPKIAKGTRDYLPEQMMIRDQAFQIIRRVFKSHGAVEIDTPVFELKDTLTGKYGEDSKLIYDLADQGGELLALRYDLTVPFARFLALNNVGNIKRFHIGKVYRRDQPQLSKGRYREFYQCDFDIAGTYGRMVPDSECLCVATEILASLPIGDFGIKLNHRRLLDAILDLCGVPSDKFRTICSAVDKLDKEPWEAVKKEMVEDKGLKEEVADKIGTFVIQKGEPWTMYNSLMQNAVFGNHMGALDALEDLRILFSYLEAMGKLHYFSFDLSLARGLDYYTGVIYEAVCMNGNTQVGSIGGGGRYDNLVSMFQEAGKITPCVGVSVGIERVFTLMEERLRQQQGGSIKQPNVSVLVAQAGENMMLERMGVCKLLWDSNISAEFNQQDNPKLKYEIANALDRAIPFMVIIGEDEAKEGKCRVKDLNARTEETVDQSQLVTTLRSKGVIPVGCEFAVEMLKKSQV